MVWKGWGKVEVGQGHHEVVVHLEIVLHPVRLLVKLVVWKGWGKVEVGQGHHEVIVHLEIVVHPVRLLHLARVVDLGVEHKLEEEEEEMLEEI